MASDLEKLDSEKQQVESRPNTGVTRERSRDSPSLAHVRSSSIARVRSNNGYGCAEDGDESTDDTVTPDQPQVEKDPFEVAWEGDHDPLCPKSMSIVRKWLVVITVGMGSLCV